MIICLKTQIKKNKGKDWENKKLDLKLIQTNQIGFHSFVRNAAIMHFNSVVLVVPLLCLPLRTNIVILYIVLVSRQVGGVWNPEPQTKC